MEIGRVLFNTVVIVVVIAALDLPMERMQSVVHLHLERMVLHLVQVVVG